MDILMNRGKEKSDHGKEVKKKSGYKKHFIKKRFLSLQIASSIVLVVVVLTVIQSSISLSSMNRSTDFALKSSLVDIAQETALQIEAQMNYYVTEATAAGNLLCREELTTKERTDALMYAKANYDFTKIMYLDRFGINISDKKDYSADENFQKAFKGQVVITDAIQDDATYEIRKYTFKIAVPVRKNGLNNSKPNAVLIVDTDRNALYNMINKINVGEYGRAFIINQNADIITVADEKPATKIAVPENIDKENIPEDLQGIYSKMTALETGSGSYVDKANGETVYVGYAPIENTPGWSVAIYALKSEFFKESKKITHQNTFLVIVFILISLITGELISVFITKPIKKITAKINKFAQLDLTLESRDEKLHRRKDEIGVMNNGIEEMRQNINRLMKEIYDTSKVIDENAEKLEQIAKETYGSSSDNSATTEELAASMQEASATTEEIKADIFNISKSVSEVTGKSATGKKLAQEIKERADIVKVSNIEKADKASTLFIEVKKKSDAALQQAKAISKIDELTNIIKTVAKQTNLLSLNASIEAARAGEQGKGFAVVAREIRELSNTVNVTTIEIDHIIGETINAVEGLAECLGQSISFIEGTAIKDLKEIAATSEQYGNDAETIKTMLLTINESMEMLNSITKQITTSIAGINTIMEQSTLGISDIADKTSEVVNMSNETNQMAGISMNNAKSLKEIVNKFKLDNR